MTEQEKQEIVAGVLQALKTNSLTLDQLSETAECSDSDFVELSKGRKISAENLSKHFVDKEFSNISERALSNKVLTGHINKMTTEYNVSVFHPGEGIDGTDKYTLETAIKCSFLDEGGKPQTWEFTGGAWAGASFSQVGSAKIEELKGQLSSQLPVIEEAKDAALANISGMKDDALQNIAEKEQEAVSNFNAQRVTPEMLSESTKQLINTAGGGTVNNLPDDEDLTTTGGDMPVLKLADRVYNPANFSGKGYKILRKNIVDGKNVLTQEMVNEPDTVYEIRYDFDIGNSSIHISEESVLFFNGGSIISSGGKSVTTNNNNIPHTIGNVPKNFIQYVYGSNLQYINFNGCNNRINVSDFGIYGNGVEDVTGKIQELLDTVLGRTGLGNTDYMTFYFPRGIYMISDPVKLNGVYRVNIVGENKNNTKIKYVPKGDEQGDIVLFDTIDVNRGFCLKDISVESELYSVDIVDMPDEGWWDGNDAQHYHKVTDNLPNARISVLRSNYNISDINISGFNGTAIVNNQINTEYRNVRVKDCCVAFDFARGNGYIQDNLLSFIRILRCGTGIICKEHISMTDSFIDEIYSHAIYSPSSIRLVSSNVLLNHVDFSGIYAEGSISLYGQIITDRCGCYYAGYSDVSEDELPKASCIFCRGNFIAMASVSFSSAKMDGASNGGGTTPVHAISTLGNIKGFMLYISGKANNENPLFVKETYANDDFPIFINGQKYSPYYKRTVDYDRNTFNMKRAGNTTSRPVNPIRGTMYYDTQIGKPVWWNGSEWTDSTGAKV